MHSLIPIRRARLADLVQEITPPDQPAEALGLPAFPVIGDDRKALYEAFSALMTGGGQAPYTTQEDGVTTSSEPS